MWLWDDMIPVMRATMLTGAGGSGKSLFAQQLATCVALGLPFLGVSTRQQTALYITCEDDLTELHRRQEAICASLGVSMSELDGKLFLLTRCGEIENSLLSFDHDGVIRPSTFYESIVSTATAQAIYFLVLDNVAHLFEGNENIRNHVAIFCNMLDRLAREICGTVLFLGHPPKNGAEFSGSTAWENQVRSRLFLSRGIAEDDQYDRDLRVLTRAKSNYAQTGHEIRMRWRDWAFEPADAPTGNWHEEMASNAQAAAENAKFVALLRIRVKQGRNVSGRPTARNYAPREFAKMPQGKGFKVDQFERAMERLFALEHIVEAEVRNSTDRHTSRCIVPAEEGAGHLRGSCGPASGQMRGSAGKPQKTEENECGPALAGQSAGQLFDGKDDTPQTRRNPSENGAGQLRGSFGGSGGQGSPPIGGLSQPPIPEPEDIIWDEPDEEGQ
jgi:KaiC.